MVVRDSASSTWARADAARGPRDASRYSGVYATSRMQRCVPVLLPQSIRRAFAR